MIRLSRIFFLLFCPVLVFAQSVHWEPSSGTLGYNQTSEVQLVFENCEPKDDPGVPSVSGLQLQAFGQSSNMSIVNGRVSQSVVVTYHVRAEQHGNLTIPSFAVNTSKGRVQVPAAAYEVGEATVGQGRVSLDAVANSRIEVPSEVWEGEVFKVEYTLNVAHRYFHSPGSNQPEWNPAPLAIEEWGKPEVSESLSGGDRRIAIIYRARASIKAPGKVTVNAASQLVNLTTGAPSFGFFSQPTLAQYAISSNRPTVEVKPLPRPAPASFRGAIGELALTSKVIPAAATVGEPITWTLALSGTGNWPDIASLPTRDVSRDFRVVQPQARRAIKEGSLYEGSLTEDVVLIPTQPGTYTLGPIVWSYFDPKKGAYQTVSTEKVVVTVSAAPLQTPPATITGATPALRPTDVQAPAGPAARTPLPSPIPRDVLVGQDFSPVPWSVRKFIVIALSPLSLVLIFWIALAARRARATDPLKPQREARLRLKETVRLLRENQGGKKIIPLLQTWQRDAAILWKLDVAAPSEKTVFTASGADQTWASLWRDAENALYRANGQLPADWFDRAETALAVKTVPSFSVFQLFRRSNLLPFAAAFVFFLVVAPALRSADPATEAYQKGDFPGAEEAWRHAVAAHPTDWVSRHNLSIALAQQNRWGESAAQAAAAFVQHPRDAAVAWQLTLAAERAGFAPGPLADFNHGSPFHALAATFSPAEWQRILVLAVAILTLSGIVMLLRAFQCLGRRTNIIAFLLLALAIAGGASGAIGLSLYRETGDSRATMVWKASTLRSIPTEADTNQKTTPLAAGTVAIVDKTFLHWSRLSFSNGQTGWVRDEDLVNLWR